MPLLRADLTIADRWTRIADDAPIPAAGAALLSPAPASTSRPSISGTAPTGWASSCLGRQDRGARGLAAASAAGGPPLPRLHRRPPVQRRPPAAQPLRLQGRDPRHRPGRSPTSASSCCSAASTPSRSPTRASCAQLGEGRRLDAGHLPAGVQRDPRPTLAERAQRPAFEAGNGGGVGGSLAAGSSTFHHAGDGIGQ